jgi:hypothetical protein
MPVCFLKLPQDREAAPTVAANWARPRVRVFLAGGAKAWHFEGDDPVVAA